MTKIATRDLRRFDRHRPVRRRGAGATFPNRPIRILVTIPPGGAPDISARMLAQGLNETLGLVGGDREPSRRQRQHRLRAGREVGARRLHAAAACRQRHHHQPACLRQAAVRSAQGPAAGRERRHQPVHAVAQSAGAGEDLPGIHRIRAQDQAAAALCVGRQRQPASVDDGDAQAARQDRPPARAVPRRRAGDHRDGRGRHQGVVLGLGERVADPVRPAARASPPAARSARRASRTCRPSASSIPAMPSTSGSACSRRPARRSRS